MAPVRTSVVMQFGPRLFNAEGELKDPEMLERQAARMLDDLAWWTYALRAARDADGHEVHPAPR